MVVKVSPSEGKTERHLESLRKAEKAWVGTNETQTKTCKEKLDPYLPHGVWAMILWRLWVFALLIAYINLKMGNDYVFETSERFRSMIDNAEFQAVKTHKDLLAFIRSSTKAVFLDNAKTYNDHYANDQNVFSMLVFGASISQERDDDLSLCMDPMVKRNDPVSIKLITLMGYNCSKKYNGMPWHPRVFVRQDEPPEIIEAASQGEKCRTCPYFKQNNISCETSNDPFVPRSQQWDMLSEEISSRYSFALDSYYPDYTYNMIASSSTILPAIEACYWLDLKTKTVEVQFLFGAITTWTFGIATYRFDFNRLGLVKHRDIKINCLKTYTNLQNRNMTTELTLDLTLAAYIGYALAIVVFLEFLFQFGNQICWLTCNHSRKNCFKRKSTRIEKTFSQRVKSIYTENHSSCKWWILTRIPGISLFLYASFVLYPLDITNQIQVEKEMLNIVTYGFKTEYMVLFKSAMYNALAASSRWQNVMIFVVVFFLGSMFEEFLKIPAFAVVPRTLLKAAPDTFYLLVTLISLLLGFGTIMTLKFGSVVDRWSDPSKGFAATYFMALGDLSTPYDEIYSSEPLLSFVLFASFSLFITIVVINIFLSVVLDSYSQVKDEISEESNRPSLKKRLQKYKGAIEAKVILDKLRLRKSGDE